MKFKKVIVLSLISFISFDLAGSYAWWWGGLYPGAHVIDISRLQRSIQITTQTLLTAQQTLQNYRNRLTNLLPTVVFSEINTTLQAIKTAENQKFSSLTGPMNKQQQAINPSPNKDNSNSAWKDFLDPTDVNLSGSATSTQNTAMRIVEVNANYDALDIIRNQNDNLQIINVEINRLTGIAELGNQGQRQIGTTQRTLLTTMMIQNLYAEAATDIATETKTKGDVIKKYTGNRQTQYLQMGTYDPYNRTIQDNTVYPMTTAKGYPRF